MTGDDMKRAVLCERYGWSSEEVDAMPRYVIDYLFARGAS